MTDDSSDVMPAQVAETHSAWVVFLGDRAYKVKKPVALEFLDFSTLEARGAILRRELELNRRLAPDVYLRVAELVADGQTCEHVLVMRRMPADRRLSTLVQEHAPLDDATRQIARMLAAFHAQAPTSEAIAAMGRPPAVRARVDTDLTEMRAFAPALLDPSVLDRVQHLAHRYLDGRVALFEQRADGGRVRDGHGDLLADDIFLLPDGPRILDCLEFDDQMRYGDVLADLAFLMMDVERLGAPDVARRLLDDYDEFTDDRHPASLVHYYVAARALVRSKVACIRARQRGGASTDAGADASAHAGSAASSLLELARAHLEQATVRLVLVGGSPGTGKSTLATHLSEQLGWALLHSDEIRKDLTGLGHTTRASAAFGAGIYDAATTRATYSALLDRGRLALEHGESVILDASWSDGTQRDAAAALARATASELVELRCDAGRETVARRIEQRLARGTDASDATAAVARAMDATFDPWPSAHRISTEGSVDDAVAAARAVATIVTR